MSHLAGWKIPRSVLVAKSADAKDLKSFFRQRECGFKSHPGHQDTTLRINALLTLLLVWCYFGVEFMVRFGRAETHQTS